MTRCSARRSAPLTLLLILAAVGLAQAAGGEPQTVAMTPEELHDRQEGHTALLVLDVRDPAEYRAGHVPGAVNLPASQVTQQTAGQLSALQGLGGVVLYCIGGSRTELAERTLLDHGVPNVFHLEGGLMGWVDSGFPVEKGAGAPLAAFHAGMTPAGTRAAGQQAPGP